MLYPPDTFDPTIAPAWDRVNPDDQQRILHSWGAIDDAAKAIVVDAPDDDPQSAKTIEEMKKAALRVFDAIVAENLNEPPA